MAKTSSGEQAGVPDELYSRAGERVWISSGYARTLLRTGTGADESLAPELDWLHNALERGQQSIVESALSCFDYTGYEPTVTLPAGATPKPTLAQIIESGDVAGSGVVMARSTGLLRGRPQVLLLVDIQDWFTRALPGSEPELVLVSYVPTRTRVAGTRACNRSYGLPPPPRVGTRVHFVAGTRDDQIEGAVPLIDPGKAVFFERNGRVHTSDDIAENTPNWEQFERLGFVEALTARSFRGEDDRGRTPMVLDLLGNGVLTSSLRGGESIVADIDGDGRAEATAWLLGFVDDVFLWIDLNGDRRVDGVQELIGVADRTPWGSVLETSGGFRGLEAYDLPKNRGNGDGRIDKRDGVWSHLGTWHDANMDGASEPSELSQLVARRIAYFDLAHIDLQRIDGSGNVIVAAGRFWLHGPGGGLHARPLVTAAFRRAN